MSPVPERVVKSTAVVNAAPVTTAETVVALISGIATDAPDELINLSGTVELTTGVAATAVRYRIRRGNGIAGVVVGDSGAVAAAAATAVAGGVEGQDTPGEVDGQQYSLTVQQTAATGNAAVSAVSLEALY